MPSLRILPSSKTIEIPSGITILEGIRRANESFESPCEGGGVCGKCRVRIENHFIDRVKILDDDHIPVIENGITYILACQTEALDNITIELEEADKSSRFSILTSSIDVETKTDPYITKSYDFDRDVTSVFAGNRLIGEETGNTLKSVYGVVVDIGTTTVVASLVNIKDRSELGSVSNLNPQAVYAQDVLSRIRFATTKQSDDPDDRQYGIDILHNAIVKELNSMIVELSRRFEIDRSHIYEIVLSGNTAMLHLILDVDPSSLGKAPYTPLITGGDYVDSIEAGYHISPFGLVYVVPIISSYVGADITSGILAAKLWETNNVSLFIDIGTNGEMILADNGKLLAASTAAGPAFEGMNITCGMWARSGAIEKFAIDNDGHIEIQTIDNAPAAGICGSGLIDIVGEFVAHKIIDSSGRFIRQEHLNLPDALKERLINKDGKLSFHIENNVILTQKDIRQVQLAKGAIRAGLEALLTSLDLEPDDVDEVLIAGSFGYHLNPESLVNIDLLPRSYIGKIKFLGNTSRSGAQAFQLSTENRTFMTKLVQDVSTLELTNSPSFEKLFVKYLGFNI